VIVIDSDSTSVVEAVHIDEIEAERLEPSHCAVEGGAIGQFAGERRDGAIDVTREFGECTERCRAEASGDSDRVAAARHASRLRSLRVSERHANRVICGG
jgi:hypothetical protein